MVVHLAKDGKYKLIAHNDEADLAVFHAALKVAHWRMNHGVKLR